MINIEGRFGIIYEYIEGLIEEIPFRGYLVQVMESNYGIFLAVVLSGLIFSGWHLILNPLDSVSQILWLLFELIPAGLILSWVFIKTKSLWLVIGLHSSYNYMQQALDIYGRYGFNNSCDNLIFLGTRVKGSQILVGTPQGSAGLVQFRYYINGYNYDCIYKKSGEKDCSLKEGIICI